MDCTSPPQLNGCTQQGAGYPPQPASVSQATADPTPPLPAENAQPSEAPPPAPPPGAPPVPPGQTPEQQAVAHPAHAYYGAQYPPYQADAWAAYYQQQQQAAAWQQYAQYQQQWPGYDPAQAYAAYQQPQSVQPPAYTPASVAPPQIPGPAAASNVPGTQHQNGAVPPWQRQSPAKAAPPTLQPPKQQQNYLKQPPAATKQQGKIGFFIKPQLPKSRQGQAAAPAYVKVEDSKPGPQAAAAAPVGGQGWPISLRSYVERSFAQKIPDEKKGALNVALKQIISDAQAKGELWTRSWETMPLPLSQAAETASLPRPAAAPTSWLAQHRAAKASNLAAKPTLEASRKNRRWSPSPERKRSKVWRRAASPDSDSSTDTTGGGRRFLEQEGRRRAGRAGRFGTGAAADARGNHADVSRKDRVAALGEDVDQVDWDLFVVKGTMQELEKSYFRLTLAPDPSTVRPESVLRRAYERLVHLLRQGKQNYFYALDQFKGMRQDCTVQHLRNDLTVNIYEAHARAALEYGDNAEYNQCQTQLDFLYRDSSVPGCRAEFAAYRILYQTAHAKQGDNAGLLNTLRNTLHLAEGSAAVSHALQVREAVFCCDYQKLFSLYEAAPNMGRALMDISYDKFRHAALNMAVRVYKPHVQVDFLTSLLGFKALGNRASSTADSAQVAGLSLPGCTQHDFPGKYPPQVSPQVAGKDCVKWLKEHGAVLSNESSPAEGAVDCKASANTLVMPAAVAVAHGDANLAIDDFLKSMS
ncbi:g4870 [Coccomyxa viridis]|uniref:G4870 protein n=1 Tax=Coccomyxa viridis TaxID=1274662 RepID=A0ABP1FRE4_9CHLO